MNKCNFDHDINSVWSLLLLLLLKVVGGAQSRKKFWSSLLVHTPGGVNTKMTCYCNF